MITVLLTILFSTLSLLLSLIIRFIFTFVATLLVLILQSFKAPGEALRNVIQQAGSVIRDYLWQIASSAGSFLVTFAFELVKDSVSSFMASMWSVAGDMVEATRTSLGGLVEGVPEIGKGLSEMVSTVVKEFWSNYKDALNHIMKNG